MIKLFLGEFKLVATCCNELHDQDEMRREMKAIAGSGLGFVDKGVAGRVLVFGNATKEERAFMAEDRRVPRMRALMQALADASRGTVTATTKRKPIDLDDQATKSGGHGAVRLSDPPAGEGVTTTPSGLHADDRVSAQGDYGEKVEARDEAAAAAAAAGDGPINWAWFFEKDEQETERVLAHLAGSHVTIFVSHLIGLKIKIYMAPGDTLVMSSLIRSAARRSRPIMLWEHGGYANGEPEPQIIINGRFPLDETEQLRLEVRAVIEEGAAQRAARAQTSGAESPKMWRDGARYEFSHATDFVPNEHAAAGLTRRAIAANAAITEHKAVAEAVEKHARQVHATAEAELREALSRHQQAPRSLFGMPMACFPVAAMAKHATALEALRAAEAELDRRRSRERGGACHAPRPTRGTSRRAAPLHARAPARRAPTTHRHAPHAQPRSVRALPRRARAHASRGC